MAGAFGRKLVATLVGLGLFVAWMQLRGGGDSGDFQELSSIPLTAFEGGGGMIDVRFTTNQPAELIATFEKHDGSTGKSTTVSGRETFPAGSYNRSVDVSPDTYIYWELNVPDAAVGAQLSWVIEVDRRTVVNESMRLDDPLEAGYAFFLQAEADDIAQMRTWR
jgi:hypothetical protein